MGRTVPTYRTVLEAMIGTGRTLELEKEIDELRKKVEELENRDTQ